MMINTWLPRFIREPLGHLKMRVQSLGWRRPGYSAPELSPRPVFLPSDTMEWYPPVQLTATALGQRASQPTCLRKVIHLLRQLDPDDYTRYLLGYYEAGLQHFGEDWRYADITTVLLAAAEMLQPENYLEIGVRRGRSMAMVAAICPDCQLLGFDFWQQNYAYMENPGPAVAREQVQRVGHRGSLELISGDSHQTVPEYLRAHPKVSFDLITVDGDHTLRGAWRDLYDVLPRLRLGGVIVFDDICNPYHPYLDRLWQHMVGAEGRFSLWHFDDLGYGVAVAVRRR